MANTRSALVQQLLAQSMARPTPRRIEGSGALMSGLAKIADAYHLMQVQKGEEGKEIAGAEEIVNQLAPASGPSDVILPSPRGGGFSTIFPGQGETPPDSPFRKKLLALIKTQGGRDVVQNLQALALQDELITQPGETRKHGRDLGMLDAQTRVTIAAEERLLNTTINAENRGVNRTINTENRGEARTIAGENRQTARTIAGENRQTARTIAGERRGVARDIAAENRALATQTAQEARDLTKVLNAEFRGYKAAIDTAKALKTINAKYTRANVMWLEGENAGKMTNLSFDENQVPWKRNKVGLPTIPVGNEEFIQLGTPTAQTASIGELGIVDPVLQRQLTNKEASTRDELGLGVRIIEHINAGAQIGPVQTFTSLGEAIGHQVGGFQKRLAGAYSVEEDHKIMDKEVWVDDQGKSFTLDSFEFGDEWSQAANQNARLKTLVISLAYARAKNANDGGRISDQDFIAQMKALSATTGSPLQLKAAIEEGMFSAIESHDNLHRAIKKKNINRREMFGDAMDYLPGGAMTRAAAAKTPPPDPVLNGFRDQIATLRGQGKTDDEIRAFFYESGSVKQ